MNLLMKTLPLLVLAATANAQAIPVPSGTEMTLFEVLIEEEPVPLARVRFVVPDIADGAVSFGDLLPDIEYLCDTVVLPALATNGWVAGEIVVSLSAQELPFGEIAPDVTQYFQPFSVADGACQWEDF